MDEEPAILEDETVAQTAPADFEDRQAGALFNDIAYSFYVANGVIKAPPAVRAGALDELAAGRRRLIDRVGLDREYWCAYIPGGVWLSTEPKLYVSLNNNETTRAELVALLDDCGALGVAADELLEGRDRSRFLGSLFEVMTNVLYLVDLLAEHAKKPKAPLSSQFYSDSLAACQKRYREARQLFNRLAQRRAQFSYFEGMVVGAVALAGVAAGLALVAPFLPRTDVHAVDIVAGCVIGGALGAIFSVLSRMTAGRLRLRQEAGKRMLWILGGVRPVVGAVAGVGLFLFIDGEAFDILKKPEGNARDYSYYAALAFLAGFSERFFQDMLVARGSAEQTTDDDKEEAKETPPLGQTTPIAVPAEGVAQLPSNPSPQVQTGSAAIPAADRVGETPR